MSIRNLQLRLQIAEELGFSNERSFRKAFQRWSGKSPAQLRREMRMQ